MINSIEAQISDISTFEESKFLIPRWIIKYTIVIEHDHVIEGRLNWNDMPDPDKIIEFINRFYD